MDCIFASPSHTHADTQIYTHIDTQTHTHTHTQTHTSPLCILKYLFLWKGHPNKIRVESNRDNLCSQQNLPYREVWPCILPVQGQCAYYLGTNTKPWPPAAFSRNRHFTQFQCSESMSQSCWLWWNMSCHSHDISQREFFTSRVKKCHAMFKSWINILQTRYESVIQTCFRNRRIVDSGLIATPQLQ